MPRNQLTKDAMKVQVEKLKTELHNENTYDSKDLAHKYLNKILDKLSEYSY